MKIVINTCYGGISEEHAALRTDPDFIKKVEKGFKGNDGVNFGGHWLNLELEALTAVEIPNEATDYLITDYDGIETLYYVLDGKIVKYGNDRTQED